MAFPKAIDTRPPAPRKVGGGLDAPERRRPSEQAPEQAEPSVSDPPHVAHTCTDTEELAEVRTVLLSGLPLAMPEMTTTTMARAAVALARAATGRPAQLDPNGCPEPSAEEWEWEALGPDHAPFWCRRCGRWFHVRRHAEAHGASANRKGCRRDKYAPAAL